MTARSAKGKSTKEIITGDRFGKAEKRIYKRTAKELFYYKVMPDIYDRIDACDTETEVMNLMAWCRRAS